MAAFWEVTLTAFVALITMVNPLAVIPPYLALTDGSLRTKRKEVAFIAGLGTMFFLTFFLLAGNYVFRFFGITLPAFQIMGGIIFFTNALRTLVDDDRRFRNLRPKGPEEVGVEVVDDAHADPIAVAIVPLSIPMLCGPGAITSTMLLVNLYPQIEQRIAILRRDVVEGGARGVRKRTHRPGSRNLPGGSDPCARSRAASRPFPASVSQAGRLSVLRSASVTLPTAGFRRRSYAQAQPCRPAPSTSMSMTTLWQN